MNLQVDFATLVSIASGITVIWGVVKLVNAPLKNIEKNSKDIKELQEEQNNQKEITKAILNGLFSIVNHMVDGNGIDSLKNSRDELRKTINDIVIK